MTETTPFEIKLILPSRALPFFESALEEIAGAILTTQIEKGVHKGKWEFQAIFEQKPDRPLIKERLVAAAAQSRMKMPLFRIRQMPDINWLKASYQGFPPISVGQYYIYGSHIKDPLPTDKICLKIDAATAFGTGEHQTTHGCLTALCDLEKAPDRVLDVGCGSGILAMAFAKSTGKPVDAVDIDPESVRVAIENVKENGLENLITVWQSDGFDKVHRQYDLIFCNILAKPLIRLAPELKVHLAPGGCAILSGFLAHQEHWVTQAYKKLGLCIIRRYPVKGWCTVVVQKDPL